MQFRWILVGGLLATIAASCSSGTKDADNSESVDGGAGANSLLRGAGAECETPSDCAVPDTVPEECADASCELGYCVFTAKDEDNDGFPRRRCISREPGVAIVTGSDCDDSDDKVNPNGWDGPADGDFEDSCNDDIDQDCNGLYDDAKLEDGTSCACTPGEQSPCATSEIGWPLSFPELVDGEPLGACKLGSSICHPNGTWGPCVGAVGPAAESCDGADNDCDGIPSLEDVDDLVDVVTFACDGDNDGYLDPTETVEITSCSEPEDSCGQDNGGRWISNPLPGAYVDCDDADANAFPGHIELCDAVDNNCNGQIDDQPPNAPSWSYDADGDGFRQASHDIIQQCAAPSTAPPDCTGACPDDAWYPLILSVGDCNDENDQINPSARDDCDGIDADCDGSAYTGCACDDTDPPIPCQIPTVDGVSVDGVGACQAGVDTCIDGKWTGCIGSVSPKPELCGDQDLNCNGVLGTSDPLATDLEHYACDADSDGYLPTTGALELDSCTTPTVDCGGGMGTWVAGPQPGLFADCDDTDPLRYPGNAEICDGVDNDCDGTLDNNAQDALIWSYDPDEDGFRSVLVATVTQCSAPESAPAGCDDPLLDVCVDSASAWVGQGQALPLGDCDETNASINPSGTDPCTGVDANCDGSALSGCDCTVGDSPQVCGSHGALDGVGRCQAGAETCASGTWAGCVGSIGPAFERCGTEDFDCDGIVGNEDADSVDLRSYACDEDADGYLNSDSAAVITTTACGAAFIPTAIKDTCPGIWHENPPPSLFADCDDTSDTAYPGRVEVCDGIDNDCNGDADSDAVNRKVWSFDPDGDGFQSNTSLSVTQCDAPTLPPDTCSGCPGSCDATLCPAGADQWVGKAGALPANDCADDDRDKNPDATDRCDGEDWDCDLTPNTGCDCQIGVPAEVCGTPPEGEVGACQSGTRECVGGFWGACVGAIGVAAERCGNVDYDCDGIVGNLDPDTPDVEKKTFACDEDSDGFVSDGNLTTAATTFACGLSFISDSCSGTWVEGPANGSDCDDTNPSANVSAKEYCGTEDLDCDGTIGDNDASAVDRGTYVCDEDSDGHLAMSGSPTTVVQCNSPTDSACNGGAGNWMLDPPPSLFDDCDDANSGVSPGGTLEICDGVDNNCDGVTDTDAVDRLVWSLDADGDGYRDQGSSTQTLCSSPGAGWVSGTGALPDGDCNDSNAGINPGANERCGAVDYDCDGSVGDADNDAVNQPVWSLDADSDGYRESSTAAVTQCASPGPSWVSGTGALAGGDCNDSSAGIHPNATEFCGTTDYDCDGTAGNSDPDAVNPKTWSVDADEDGYAALGSSPVEQCTSPGADYVSSTGALPATDCADNDGSVHPNATEFCDTVDNDCDSVTDTDAVDQLTWSYDADSDGYRDSSNATVEACDSPGAAPATCTGTCPNDAWTSATGSLPGGDCDDDDATLSPLVVWSLDADNDGFALDGSSTIVQCSSPGASYSRGILPATDCNDANSSIQPNAIELCDTVDNNCDGTVDTDAVNKADYYCDQDGDGRFAIGSFGSATESCSEPAPSTCNSGNGDWIANPGSSYFDDCNDSAANMSPFGVQEICDGLNNDCSGGNDWANPSEADESADLTGSPAIAGTTFTCGGVSGWTIPGGTSQGGGCPADELNCDGNANNGCEALGTSLDDCGSCDNTCDFSCGGSAGARNCVEIASLGLGRAHSCATMSSGQVSCWGRGSSGELGEGDNNDRALPIQTSVLTDTVQVSGGGTHSCAIEDSTLRQIYCWGEGGSGQLGHNSTSDESQPRATTLTGATDVSAGYEHTCAVGSSGGLYCWGQIEDGRLGNTTVGAGIQQTPLLAYEVQPGPSPGQVADAEQVASGRKHTCVLKTGGTIFCVGDDTDGQMGNAGAPSYAGYFEEITSLSGFGAVAAGDDHTCAIRSGSVYCWGDNEVGQCGQPKTTDVEVPTQVPGLSSVTDIALGAFFSCALSGGQVYCWGSNSYGQAGDDSDPDFDDPRLIRNPSDTGNLSGVTALSAGGEHACAQVGSSGPVYCWGYNANAQLGVGYFDTTHYLPEDLSPLNN